MSVFFNFLQQTIDAIKKCQNNNEINKSSIRLFYDIVSCGIKYGSSPNNYYKFEFFKLSDAKRKTWVTNRMSCQLIAKWNNPSAIHILEDKLEFANMFKDFHKRIFLDTSEMKYEDFKMLAIKGKFICKPTKEAQGRGIHVYHTENLTDIELNNIFLEIKELYGTNYILEEWINQHDELSKIYPKAVNCLRIITVRSNKMHILTGGITFALNDEIANGCCPSIIAPVNMKTGIIDKPAATFGSKLYEKHPTTGAQIYGIKVPFWDDIIEMLDKITSRCSGCGYVGWDIAITPTGPIIIEGNTTPGYQYYQIPAHHPNGIGNKPIYEKFL